MNWGGFKAIPRFFKNRQWKPRRAIWKPRKIQVPRWFRGFASRMRAAQKMRSVKPSSGIPGGRSGGVTRGRGGLSARGGSLRGRGITFGSSPGFGRKGTFAR